MDIIKKDRHYTLLVLTDADSRIRKFQIHYNWLRLAFIFAGIVIIAMATLISNIYLVRGELDNRIAEFERLHEKISYKEVEIANLETKSNEIKAKTKILEDYLAQVEDLDKMVRDITGKGGYEGQVAIYSTDLDAGIDFSGSSGEMFYYDFHDSADLNDINRILDELIAKAPEMSLKLSQDKQHMEDHIYRLDHTPSIWPTTGVLTSRFREYRGAGRYHGGIDIANSVGTDVSASAAGFVVFAGRNQGFGNQVIIHHGFGYMTVYAHLNKMLVSVGDDVTKGQVIAEMGNTGYSTGPHLHYEVIKDDVQVNPMEYLP